MSQTNTYGVPLVDTSCVDPTFCTATLSAGEEMKMRLRDAARRLHPPSHIPHWGLALHFLASGRSCLRPQSGELVEYVLML